MIYYSSEGKLRKYKKKVFNQKESFVKLKKSCLKVVIKVSFWGENCSSFEEWPIS